jgi:predicted nucleic acid-binding protein
MIRDTNHFIHLLRQDDATFRKGMELFEHGVPLRVSMATVFELCYGAAITLDDADYRGEMCSWGIPCAGR